MIKGIGLIRVSTEEQSSERHAGVPAQRNAIQTIAQQRGIELVRTFEITDVSGSRILTAPEFQSFLYSLEDPTIKAVVTKEFSRLMRPENFSDYTILQVFVDHDVTLHLPDGPIDFSKKFDKFAALLKAGMAGLELEEIRRRMEDGKEELRKQGKHPGGNHTLPKGIAYSKEREWYYTDDIELVKQIFRLFQSGEHNLAEIWRQTGIPRSTVANTLKNHIYTGWMIYDKKRDPSEAGYVPGPDGKQGYRKKIKREPDEIIKFELPLEPLLSEEEFQAIQTTLERRRRTVNKTRSRNKPRFTYNGFLFCPDCNAPLYTHNSGTDFFYHCSSKREDCTNKYMRRDRIEPKIDSIVENRLTNPSFLSPIIDSYLYHIENQNALEPSLETITAKLESLDKKRSRVLDSFYEGAITKEERDRALQTIQEEIKAYRLIEPPTSLAQDQISAAVVRTTSVFKEWSFLSRAQKRQLLNQLLPEIFAYRYIIKGLTIRFSSPNSSLNGENAHPSKTVKSPLAGQHAP